MHRRHHHQQNLSFRHVKQTDSMLPWVCTVTDQEVSTSCTTFLFSPHFDAIEV